MSDRMQYLIGTLISVALAVGYILLTDEREPASSSVEQQAPSIEETGP